MNRLVTEYLYELLPTCRSSGVYSLSEETTNFKLAQIGLHFHNVPSTMEFITLSNSASKVFQQ